MRRDPIHFRAFRVTVWWTLALLFLGSVVHATGSSLACPDWPTCHGSFLPAMEGGVFWEHLHRLVAGGLILMFGLATWLVRREEPGRPWLFKLSLAGVALLLVQAVFGGLTVLLRLPDAVSTTHLGLALLFLMLAVSLGAATAPKDARAELDTRSRGALRVWATAAAGIVFVQSLLGGVVRHMEAGLACPDVPKCLGQWVPPFLNPWITVHFAHRTLGVLTLTLVVLAAARLYALTRSRQVRRTAAAAGALVILQVGLGFLSVSSGLSVLAVSLHTVAAASLLAVLVLLACWGWLPASSAVPPNPAASGSERQRGGPVGAHHGRR